MSDKVLFWAEGDSEEMLEAYANAQKTFKYFWRELSWEYRRIIPALTFACVKVAFSQQVEGDESPIVEHMWINDISFDGNNVSGVLVNDPNELTNVANGDFVSVPLNEISDWLYAVTDNRFDAESSHAKTYGGFTIQVLRSEMSDDEREEHDNAWGLDFGDYNEVLLANGQKEHPENMIEHPMSKNMKGKLIEFLEANPEEISNADENGFTLLHNETIAGNLSSVEVLLSFGADKNMKTNQGETALDFAEKLNWEELIKLLK